MFCAVCAQPIFDDQWPASYTWVDPDGMIVAGHAECLTPFEEILAGMEL